MVLRARLGVAEKFHFRDASRANCRIATYKRISAGYCRAYNFSCQQFYDPAGLSFPVLAEIDD